MLLDAAARAATFAYAPYSHFPVGAAVLTSSGQLFTGCNVENAAFGETICAERNAVTTMVAAGFREIDTVAVVGGDEPCWPCGACRQVLAEFGCRRVVVTGPDGPLEVDFTDLLPHSFGGPRDLSLHLGDT
ncbi:cytidine deaminase [Corynebacterium sp. YIM 101645]|uniref:Cytidine deaminase n=1 Tax=Corynebacterium lemuris TaxID=1859292 RepID=A0ABT2FWV5_9CORY|nr:cytidine deaminase [Corynebacterium lemuris]MCS5479285.1 cytidine deaminase [Corynebacterium lemuris]